MRASGSIGLLQESMVHGNVCMNNPSSDAGKGKATTTKQQKGKAIQHNSPETVIFQRKIGCLGWDSNPRPSALRAMLLPTELLRQLSWLGRILHTNHKASQPDEQVNFGIYMCIADQLHVY